MGEQPIAQENARLVAPFGIDGRSVAADRGRVEDVVVDQGGSMDHFDHGGERVMRGGDAAACFGRQQQEHGPEAFAAIVREVIDEQGDAGARTFESLPKNALDAIQIAGNGGQEVGAGTERQSGGGHARSSKENPIHCASHARFLKSRRLRNFS